MNEENPMLFEKNKWNLTLKLKIFKSYIGINVAVIKINVFMAASFLRHPLYYL